MIVIELEQTNWADKFWIIWGIFGPTSGKSERYVREVVGIVKNISISLATEQNLLEFFFNILDHCAPYLVTYYECRTHYAQCRF